MTDYWSQKLHDKSAQSFVGRTRELNTLLAPLSTDSPDELITHIFGVGGIGKTSLLDRFEILARKKSVTISRINEAQKSVRDVLVKIASDLSSPDHFTRAYQAYQQLEHQVQADPAFFQALQESSGRVYKTTSESSLQESSLFDDIEDEQIQYNLQAVRELLTSSLDETAIISFCYDQPEFRPVHDQFSHGMSKSAMLQYLIEFADRQLLLGNLLKHVRNINPRQFERYQGQLYSQNLSSTFTASVAEDSFGFLDYVYQKVDDLESRELLIRTDHVLTKALLQDIIELAQNRRTIIIFDTYEFLSMFVDDWLREEIFDRNLDNLPPNLTFVMAGREPLGDAWTAFTAIIKQIELNPFSEAETREFLRDKGISDQATIQSIQDMSGNLPLMLALVATATDTRVDELTATQNVIERFLKWIPKQESSKREAILVCAFPRFFDESVVETLIPGIDAAEIFTWLQSFSFINGNTGRWRYHSIVRRLIIQYQYDRNPEKYHEWHQTLADYYLDGLNKFGDEVDLGKTTETLDFTRDPAQRYLGVTTGDSEYDSSSYRNKRVLELEWLYHKLCQNEEFDTFLRLFIQSFRWSSYAQQLVNTFMEAQEDLHERSNYYDWYLLFKKVPQCRDAIDCSLPDWVPLFERLSEYEGLSNLHQRAIVFYQLGYHYTKQKRFARAEQVYREAIRLDPDYVSAYNGLGTLMRNMGNLDEAEKLYRHCIQLNANYIFPYYNLGQVLRKKDAIEEADEFYRRSIKLRPNLPFSYFNYANFLREVQRFPDACNMYRRAIEMDPAHVAAHINLGAVLEKIGNLQEAESEYQQAIELSPREYLAYLNLGLLKSRSDPLDAITYFDKCIEIEPQRPDAHVPKARLLESLGRDREALEAYRYVDDLIPNNPAVQRMIAGLFEKLGRLNEAIEQYEAYLELMPEDTQTRQHIQELRKPNDGK